MTAFRCAGSTRSAAWFVGCVLAVSFAATAHAQSFEVNRFRPAPLARDGFAVDSAETSGHLKVDAALYVDYSRKPLQLVLATGDRYDVVSDQLALHASFALGLTDRVALFAGAPFNLKMDGDDPPAGITTRLPAADGPGFGDAHAGARVRLLGEQDGPAVLALQATAFLPLASVDDTQLYSGDDGVGVEPQALLQFNAGPVTARINAGVRIRPEQSQPDVEVGNELTYGLGLECALADDRLRLIADAFGASFLDDLGGSNTTPVELLIGAKYHTKSGLFLGLGAGPGLNSGVGTPELRGVATLGFSSPVQLDRDGDGLLDDADQCPDAREDADGFEDHDGCPDLDDDRDGIADAHDRCLREPEDTDGFEDQDGCPDPDNDGDGVADTEDNCVNEPEDRDGHDDADGCPDPDDDGDGIADANDQCPSQPEDADGFQDEDGCPDPDNDQDGVADASDRCPNDAGEADNGGCPVVHVDTEKGMITITERVEFALNKDVILESSHGLLGKVKQAIESNPQILRVRIEGHTDSQGKDKRNLELSKRRARSVARWLVTAGIAKERLEMVGCGENRPIDDNATSEGRQRNRRVEFHIVDPAPETPRSMDGCQPIAF